MKTNRLLAQTLLAGAIGMATFLGSFSSGNAQTDKPAKLAATPPMGWNSYDAFGSSVTEEEFLANAACVKEKLLACGYDTVVVDYRWSDATAANYGPNGIGGPLVADAFGRLLPAPNRFPSAADGRGFQALADKIHAMGLKFGIHVMRGIPRQSVADNTPIEGSAFKAADAADTRSTCDWCKDMWGIDATKQAGRDYYHSIFRLYASWGVDYVKVDDLSHPYHREEIEAIRRAIDDCGRPMVFSTSPGETPVDMREHVSAHANMWRISADFWDNWKSLNHLLDLAARWQDVGGPGAWPDADMIPFGKIALRCVGKPRQTKFTKDEQRMLFSLLALMPSPLMLGMNLPENDAWTEELITNKEVIAINQDPLGKKGRRLRQDGQTEVWVRELRDNRRAVGFFNRDAAPAEVQVSATEMGLSGEFTARDLWSGNEIAVGKDPLVQKVPPHGAALFLLVPAQPPRPVAWIKESNSASGPVDLSRIRSPIVFQGDKDTAYRDPAVIYHDGVFRLFFTLVTTGNDGKPNWVVAVSRSTNLVDWTPPRSLTLPDRNKNFSSPGNVVKFGNEWVLCLQSYPTPHGEKYGDSNSRLWVMRSQDLEKWSEPELLKVKGPDTPFDRMGRMIDPFLLQDKDAPGKWWCFYKQNGISRSWSRDLRLWTYAGRVNAGENPCVLVQGNEYVLFHSPPNGIGVKRSPDLENWRDAGQVTLGQSDWPWAKGRLTAGFVVDLRAEPGVGKYLMFFHGSGPEDEKTMFNNFASVGLAWSDDLIHWKWPGTTKSPVANQ